MSSTALAALLQAIVSLLALLSANPSLPQATRDNALQIVQQTINQATLVIQQQIQNEPQSEQEPFISSISPLNGPTSTQITIQGGGFTSDNTIHFGSGGAMHVASNGGSLLYFTVPNFVGPCDYVGDTSTVRCMVADSLVHSGQYTVSVANTNGQSNSVDFFVTAPEPDFNNPFMIEPTRWNFRDFVPVGPNNNTNNGDQSSCFAAYGTVVVPSGGSASLSSCQIACATGKEPDCSSQTICTGYLPHFCQNGQWIPQPAGQVVPQSGVTSTGKICFDNGSTCVNN